MLETIVSYLVSCAGEGLEWIINGFLTAMSNIFTLSDMVATFPFLIEGYRLFQSIGVGLIACIAVWNLIKFFGGQLTSTRDTPLQILIRAGLSGALIWWGGYFLEWAVSLAKIPFDTMINADGVTQMAFTEVQEYLSESPDWFIVGAATLSVATLMLVALVIILLIGWNVLKLLVEVCERYLMVTVLVYTSPLLFSTYTSSSTGEIFKKWVSMFFGQLVLMTLSAWMLKLIVSGFSFTASDTNVFFRFMLTLALCKIAQRTDTYMQQLGIGVATTGGNLLDEAIGVGMALSRRGKGGKNDAEGASSKSAVLGAGADGSLSRTGGLFGGISNAVQKGVRDFKSGANAGAIFKNLGYNFAQGAGIDLDAVKKDVENARTSATKAEAAGNIGRAGMRAAAGFATGGTIGNAINSMRAARAASMDGTNRSAAEKAAQMTETFNRRAAAYTGYQNPKGTGAYNQVNKADWHDATREKLKESGITLSQFTQANRQAYGVGTFETDSEGRPQLDEVAEASGLSMPDTGPEAYADMLRTTEYGADGAELRDAEGNAIPHHFTEGEALLFNEEFASEEGFVPVQGDVQGTEVTQDMADRWNADLAAWGSSGADGSAATFSEEQANQWNKMYENEAGFAPVEAGMPITDDMAAKWRSDNQLLPFNEDGSVHRFTEEEAARWNDTYAKEPDFAPVQGSQEGTVVTQAMADKFNATLDQVPVISGASDVVGDFTGANFNKAGEAGNEVMNESLINTVRSSPLAAEQAAMNPYNEMSDNDQLGDAILKSAFGEAAITGQEGGKFSNIKFSTNENQQRVITADYTDSAGNTTSYQIAHNDTYTGPNKIATSGQQLSDTASGRMTTIESKGSGDRITVRSIAVEQSRVETGSASDRRHDMQVSSNGGQNTSRSETKTIHIVHETTKKGSGRSPGDMGSQTGGTRSRLNILSRRNNSSLPDVQVEQLNLNRGNAARSDRKNNRNNNGSRKNR